MPGPDNFQLYTLIRNKKLQASIRIAAQALWEQRNISPTRQQQIKDRYDNFFQPEEDQPMKMKFRLLIVLFPFAPEVWILQVFISSRLLGLGNREKWYGYWQAVLLGHLLWTIALILFGHYFFRTA